MRIGYACQLIGLPQTTMRRCIMKNATPERLTDLIFDNLKALENILDYNIQNDIRLFRISSDLIPFGSSPVNTLPWWDMFEGWLKTIGQRILSHRMRVSMHPGQYTVLNSPQENIVNRAIDDLVYHVRVLDTMALGPEHKIILHIGGVYQDKELARSRFIQNYQRLGEPTRKRLVIENDDKSFSIEDVLNISEKLSIPVVYDTLHNSVNPSDPSKSHSWWIERCRKTWTKADGSQKIHYSQQAPGKSPGSHSDSIDTEIFKDFFETIQNHDLDIMMEVKDKNISALKCIHAVRALRDTQFPA